MIEPALTPEEWADIQEYPTVDQVAEAAPSLVSARYIRIPMTRHALAALALHAQPFGFTPQDVAALRFAAQEMLAECSYAHADILTSLADRIQALLPPAVPPEGTP